MNDRVRLGISDGIAEVRLMRADKMNALDPAMFEAIASAGEQLKSDPDVRVVVVSGEGRAFCAGLDVERITAATRGESILPFVDLTKRTHGVANFAQHIVWLWREASSSRSAPTCVTPRRIRASPLSRPNGVWCPTWAAPS